MSTSVSSGPCGPCCSVAPVGTITVLCDFRKVSTSGFVSSPRKTVGFFMGAGGILHSHEDPGGTSAGAHASARSERHSQAAEGLHGAVQRQGLDELARPPAQL